jgi:CBS domain-containing protein
MTTEGADVKTVTSSNIRRAAPASALIRVSHAMHKGVLTCPKDASLAHVAELMASHRVHCVVVADELEGVGSVWGIVSDLDLAAAASVRDLDEQTAGATAATAVLTVSPEETVQRAAQLMTEHGASHLVVVDSTRRPIGILSTLDVAAALGES